MKYLETYFCIFYLVFAYIAAFVFFYFSSNNVIILLFGLLTIILAGGDSFHLVPRILKAFNFEFNFKWWAGLGLMISSITMTIFYIILFIIWKLIFNIAISPSIFWILLFMAILRIVLCLFPQNNWFNGKENYRWSIYRNTPFIIIGIIVAFLYLRTDNLYGLNLWQIGLAIIISFLCYLPVVLFSKKNPKIGMLMIPKTLAYIWMIIVGLSLIGKI